MAATKVALSTGFSATATAVGATTTGSTMTISTAYPGSGAAVNVTTTTAPTTAGVVSLYCSDGTTTLLVESRSIGLAASTVYLFRLEFPDWAQAARIDITAGTGTGITTTAIAGSLTGI